MLTALTKIAARYFDIRETQINKANLGANRLRREAKIDREREKVTNTSDNVRTCVTIPN